MCTTKAREATVPIAVLEALAAAMDAAAAYVLSDRHMGRRKSWRHAAERGRAKGLKEAARMVREHLR